MTKTDLHRLSQIRAESEKWQALREDAYNWEVPTLLRIIDSLTAELKTARKGKGELG